MPRPYLASWIVVVYANLGVIIADSLLIILGAEISMAGQLAKEDGACPHLTSPVR